MDVGRTPPVTAAVTAAATYNTISTNTNNTSTSTTTVTTTATVATTTTAANHYCGNGTLSVDSSKGRLVMERMDSIKNLFGCELRVVDDGAGGHDENTAAHTTSTTTTTTFAVNRLDAYKAPDDHQLIDRLKVTTQLRRSVAADLLPLARPWVLASSVLRWIPVGANGAAV